MLLVEVTVAAKKADSTLLVLREIRDAVTATNNRVDKLASRMGDLAERVEQLATGLQEQRRLQVESEIRLATVLSDVHATVRDVAALIRETRASERLASLEHRIAELERKAG